MEDLINNIWFQRGIWTLVTIIIGLIVYKLITSLAINRIDNKLSSKKSKTYTRMFKSIIRYVILIIVLLIILQIFGINVSSMVAGVGIISIILGFAIQDALKDIIKGIDILSDNYYQVGDIIKFQDITGRVLAIGLKTTKLEDIYSLNKVSLANRNIEKVEVVSNLINIDIPLPYEMKVVDAEKVIEEIVNDIKKQDNISKVEYRGINLLDSSSINYQIKVYCDPINKVQVRRDCLRYIMVCLNKHDISVPYQQIDIHN